MHKRYLLTLYRFFFGCLALAAIAFQLFQGMQRPTFNGINFLSFFTIESNIVAAIIFLVSSGLTYQGKESTALAVMRGAATLYMTVTGIVYVLLLSGLEESLQTPIPWVNAVLHYIMPLAVLFDWFIDLPRRHMLFRRALMWMAFPAIYLMYSLIRGELTGWYPYPFLDPSIHGYGGVAITCMMILGVMLALTWFLTKSTQIYSKRR